MIGYIQTNQDGRILAAAEIESYIADPIEAELPDDFFDQMPSDYVYQNGQVIFSPAPPTEEELKAERQQEERENFLTNGPSQLADIDDILCGLYETNLELQYQIDQLGGDIL